MALHCPADLPDTLSNDPKTQTEASGSGLEDPPPPRPPCVHGTNRKKLTCEHCTVTNTTLTPAPLSFNKYLLTHDQAKEKLVSLRATNLVTSKAGNNIYGAARCKLDMETIATWNGSRNAKLETGQSSLRYIRGYYMIVSQSVKQET